MKKSLHEAGTFLEEIGGVIPKPFTNKELQTRIKNGVDTTDIRGVIYPNLRDRIKSQHQLKLRIEAVANLEDDDVQQMRTAYESEDKALKKFTINEEQRCVRVVENVLETAQRLGIPYSSCEGGIYQFNGAFWKLTDRKDLTNLLGTVSEQISIDRDKSRYHKFKEKLFDQFVTAVQSIEPNTENNVLINLSNGTYVVGEDGLYLRPFTQEDFLRYQLPFAFDAGATAPMFMEFLNTVLPDASDQAILAEYLGYIFIPHRTLRLEKMLLLYGTGANGKSVIFDIVKALVAAENMTCYSLESLTDKKGYERVKIGGKLLNYSSEINGELQPDKLKQLVSGEPIEARLPYGEPFILTDYAKMLFNCNELPRSVENTNGFFRRLLILHFSATIADKDQDKKLADRIIKSELAGIFNWVLEGATRLLKQQMFTESLESQRMLNQYRTDSDSVLLFVHEEGYSKSIESFIPAKEFFEKYQAYCVQAGYRPLNRKHFTKRLEANGFVVSRKTEGMVVFASHLPM
jgi:putative DNA primase/helicase